MDTDRARLDAAFAHCEALLRERDKDRFLASLFAPAESRPLLQALYAFDVDVNDIAGRVREPLAGELRLQWWRDVIEGRREEEASAAPVAAAVRSAIAQRQLPADPFLRHLDAHTFDVYGEPMRSVAELERYAHESTGSILQLAALALGGELPGELIHNAASAITITDILRHLGRHVSQGRLFVPLEILERHGAEAIDMAAGHATAEIRAAITELAALARARLDDAERLLGNAPVAARPALLPLALVPLYLARLNSDGDPFRRDTSVAQWHRQWRLWRAARAIPRTG